MSTLRLAPFRLDVTPPLGSPLCAGLVAPAREIADPLFAIGVILLGEEAPVVLCAVDWCEINDDAHLRWRDELARAVDTTPDRVALHTVHQHNAPIADLEAQRLVEGVGGIAPLMDTGHYGSCLAASAESARSSLSGARTVTGVALGSVVVKEVASARRILGQDGRVRLTRWSSAREQELREAAEGTIDPLLRTMTFLGDQGPMASLHFYATHPMSYYGDGVVTSDFAGLARERRCSETPGCEHIYFNGCGGDITAGKYNEGTPESRVRLTGRIHDALVKSEKSARSIPLARMAWDGIDMRLPPRRDLRVDLLETMLRDPAESEMNRKMAAQRLAYLHRQSIPTRASCLRIGEAGLLFLPGEPFIDYQLFATEKDRNVAVAGDGDTGPGYIPLVRSYEEGGYEIGASSVSEDSEAIVKSAISALLSR